MKDYNLESALYIVPTPIGNLEDITLRAINVLNSVDIIACEDTRRSGMLLKSLEISHKSPLQSYHDFNEETKSTFLIDEILAGKSLALISDAGTPCISDPGYRLVNKAIQNNIKIISLPGATALIPAFVASGFSVHNFTFFGFPPQKKGRHTFVKNVLNNKYTSIIYESSHRIIKLISEIAEMDNNRNICVGREISKVFEEYIRINTADISNNSIKITEKGEFVVIIEAKH